MSKKVNIFIILFIFIFSGIIMRANDFVTVEDGKFMLDGKPYKLSLIHI